MKRLLSLILGAWVAMTAAAAQGADPINDVIGGQLQSFNDRDVQGAWHYASPTIKDLFGDARNFGVMVQRAYPMVWDNADVRFLDRREIAGNLWQKVMIRDAQGGLHMLDYQMIQTPDGWQINAVQLLRAPDIGV
ncbi:DUF4864 domain-containing protein [Loktanella agnita]|uniref:DUF4864 domain-containing protein n=1 Tax=Loktanella agnita TaxID=287097 RepID=UPI0039886ADF